MTAGPEGNFPGAGLGVEHSERIPKLSLVSGRGFVEGAVSWTFQFKDGAVFPRFATAGDCHLPLGTLWTLTSSTVGSVLGKA